MTIKRACLAVLGIMVLYTGLTISTTLPYRVRTPHGSLGTEIRARVELAFGATLTPVRLNTLRADGGDGVCDGDEAKYESCYNPQNPPVPGPCICWPGGCASMECVNTGQQSRCNMEVMGEPCWGCGVAENTPCL
jgi:hypothetical protein